MSAHFNLPIITMLVISIEVRLFELQRNTI